MTYQDDDLDRLRAWLIEDTGSESEASRLLPVAERLRSLPGLTIDQRAQAALTRRLIQELQARWKPGPQRTAVCIEDDAAMIDLVTLILKTKGFEVFGAMSGPEGLKLVSTVKPDLVLLDLVLPGMDGWEVYQQMKADETMRTVPVIMVTAKAQTIDKVLGLHIAKVGDYLTKPFSAYELMKSIDKVLGVTDEDS